MANTNNVNSHVNSENFEGKKSFLPSSEKNIGKQAQTRPSESKSSRLKNLTDLQVRIATGSIYIALTVICIFAGEIPNLIMICVTAGICANEFYYMLRADAKLPNEVLGIIGAVLYPISVYIYGFSGAIGVTFILMILLLIWYVFFMRARVQDVGISFFGAVYTGLLLSGMVYVRSALPDIWGALLTLGIFVSIWFNDSMAYLVGSKFGKHKLTPKTSPKKTWEGFIAGLLASMVTWLCISFIPPLNLSIPLSLLFGFLTGLAGVLGDLAESRIKRNSGFKDSGTIMPGHGGLLDRTDSLFLVSVSSVILLVLGGCF